MLDWFMSRLMLTIVIGLILLGAAVAVWQAIPTIIKVLAIVGIIIGFLKIVKD